MSRFITPSKIGLLILIELYIESIALSSSSVPIITFILDQLLPQASKFQNLESASSLKSFPRDLSIVNDLKSFELLLTNLQACPNDNGISLWDRFLKKIWAIDSLDALHTFFAQRSKFLARTCEETKNDRNLGIPPPSKDMILLSHTSPLGSFTRRSQIEFECLKFTDSVKLWVSFSNWRCKSNAPLERNDERTRKLMGNNDFDEENPSLGARSIYKMASFAFETSKSQNPIEGYISTDDVEKFLEFQIEKMQKLGNRIPCEVMDKFKFLLEQSILIPSLSHYLIFLESWRSGDYPTSFDSLHRYFDYTMQNRDRLFYQYALMNLAVLQADFCCFDEAVAAMLETVATARENKDMACLNFALNWLYHFGKIHPKIIAGIGSTNMLGVEREGLSFLRIKAKETGMWTLWSSSLLSEGKLAMANGENVATVFEIITKSSQLIVEKNMKNMIGPQMAVYSSLWQRLGISQLFKQYCDVFLSHHAQYSAFEDILRFTNRNAYFLAGEGRYDKAISTMRNFDSNSLRSRKTNHYWLKCIGIIRLKRSLHQDNLDDVAQLLTQLLQSNDEDKDMDLSFEITMLHIDYHIRKTDYCQALAKIEEVLSSTDEDGNDINLRLTLLVSKALLYSKAGRPQKGFSIALRAASIAWRARLLPTLWAAMGAVANILTSLSEFQASAQILTAIFPRVLEHQNCSLNAQLYSYLVDAYMGLAGEAGARNLARKENLTHCLGFAQRALNEFSALEDVKGQREMTAKLAVITKVMQEPFLADKFASAYLCLKRQSY